MMRFSLLWRFVNLVVCATKRMVVSRGPNKFQIAKNSIDFSMFNVSLLIASSIVIDIQFWFTVHTQCSDEKDCDQVQAERDRAAQQHPGQILEPRRRLLIRTRSRDQGPLLRGSERACLDGACKSGPRCPRWSQLSNITWTSVRLDPIIVGLVLSSTSILICILIFHPALRRNDSLPLNYLL